MRNIILEDAIAHLRLLSGLVSHLEYTDYCTHTTLLTCLMSPMRAL